MSRLLTNEQAAEQLGWAPNTLEKKRVTGESPPYIKMGRSVRYREQDLAEWIAARIVYSTSEKAAA